MAYDIEKIRQKLENLKNGNKGGMPKEMQNNTWKPKKPGDGASQVRLIANPHNDEEPFSELYFHFDIGRPGFICPEMTFGKTCPACEMRKQLYQEGGEMNKNLAKKFFPKPRYYALVVDREDEERKPKYWAFGKLIYKDLLEALLDSDYCTFLDPKVGLDMTIEQSQDPKKSFVDTNFKFRRKESALAKTDEEVAEIMDRAPALMDVFGSLKLDVKQIQDRVENFLSPKDDSFEEREEVDNSENVVVKGKKSKDSVDDAFEELLNDEDIADDE